MKMKDADGHTEMNILLRSSFIHFKNLTKWYRNVWSRI